MRIGKPIEQFPDSGLPHPHPPGPGTPASLQREVGGAAADANPDPLIRLPHRELGTGFSVRQLVDYMEPSGREYIIGGEVDCYWLRENFAANKGNKTGHKRGDRAVNRDRAFRRGERPQMPGHRDQLLRLATAGGVSSADYEFLSYVRQRGDHGEANTIIAARGRLFALASNACNVIESVRTKARSLSLIGAGTLLLHPGSRWCRQFVLSGLCISAAGRAPRRKFFHPTCYR